jgi:hypothetical protein
MRDFVIGCLGVALLAQVVCAVLIPFGYRARVKRLSCKGL